MIARDAWPFRPLGIDPSRSSGGRDSGASDRAEGLSHLMRTIQRVKRSLNPLLEIQGIVLTMFDRRNNLCDMVAQDVRSHLGKMVYDTVIPRNVRVSEAPSHGKPVLLYDLQCAGSQAYIRLAREVLRRESASKAASSPAPVLA